MFSICRTLAGKDKSIDSGRKEKRALIFFDPRESRQKKARMTELEGKGKKKGGAKILSPRRPPTS